MQSQGLKRSREIGQSSEGTSFPKRPRLAPETVALERFEAETQKTESLSLSASRAVPARQIDADEVKTVCSKIHEIAPELFNHINYLVLQVELAIGSTSDKLPVILAQLKNPLIVKVFEKLDWLTFSDEEKEHFWASFFKAFPERNPFEKINWEGFPFPVDPQPAVRQALIERFSEEFALLAVSEAEGDLKTFLAPINAEGLVTLVPKGYLKPYASLLKSIYGRPTLFVFQNYQLTTFFPSSKLFRDQKKVLMSKRSVNTHQELLRQAMTQFSQKGEFDSFYKWTGPYLCTGEEIKVFFDRLQKYRIFGTADGRRLIVSDDALRTVSLKAEVYSSFSLEELQAFFSVLHFSFYTHLNPQLLAKVLPLFKHPLKGQIEDFVLEKRQDCWKELVLYAEAQPAFDARFQEIYWKEALEGESGEVYPMKRCRVAKLSPDQFRQLTLRFGTYVTSLDTILTEWRAEDAAKLTNLQELKLGNLDPSKPFFFDFLELPSLKSAALDFHQGEMSMASCQISLPSLAHLYVTGPAPFALLSQLPVELETLEVQSGYCEAAPFSLISYLPNKLKRLKIGNLLGQQIFPLRKKLKLLTELRSLSIGRIVDMPPMNADLYMKDDPFPHLENFETKMLLPENVLVFTGHKNSGIRRMTLDLLVPNLLYQLESFARLENLFIHMLEPLIEMEPWNYDFSRLPHLKVLTLQAPRPLTEETWRGLLKMLEKPQFTKLHYQGSLNEERCRDLEAKKRPDLTIEITSLDGTG